MELLALALLGGIVALDGTSVGQVMISRPLVAGTLAGVLLGDPALGLLVGALLEIFFLVVLPAGGALFPEGGPAAVVAVAGAVMVPGHGGVAFGILSGLAWGQIAGVSIVLLRQVNGRLAPNPGEGPVTPGVVSRRHLAGITLDFLRGAVLTFGAALLATVLGEAIAAQEGAWPLGGPGTSGLILLGVAAPLGILLRIFIRGREGFVLFAVGIAGGLLLAAL